MNFDQAKEKALTLKWTTITCSQGEDCWCRGITPEIPIKYDSLFGEEEYYDVVSTGNIDKELAEYIVNLHNKTLS